MTGKLFRLQFMDTWRTAGPFSLLGSLIVLIILPLAWLLGLDFFKSLSVAISFLLITLTAGYGFIMTIYNDYQNMQGKRAYFVRAIPVSDDTLFRSRFMTYLAGFLLVLIKFILDLLLIFFLMWILQAEPMSELGRHLAYMRVVMFKPLSLFMIFLAFLYLIYYVFVFMASISIGSESRWQRFGIGGPILVFALFFIFLQMVGIVSILFIPLSIKLPPGPIRPAALNLHFVNESMWSKLFETGSYSEAAMISDPILGIGFVPVLIFFTALAAFLTYRSMSKKLSLS